MERRAARRDDGDGARSVLCLRRRSSSRRAGAARIAVTTALARDARESRSSSPRGFTTRAPARRTFELGWTDARVELQAPRHLRRPGAALPAPGLGGRLPQRRAPSRARVRARTRARHGGALGATASRATCPSCSIRLDDAEVGRPLSRGAPRARVLAPQRPHGRSGHPQRGAEQLPAAAARADAQGPRVPSPAQAPLDQPGGVFVRRADQMPEPDQRAAPGHRPRRAALLAGLAHPPAPARARAAVGAPRALRRPQRRAVRARGADSPGRSSSSGTGSAASAPTGAST